MTGEAGPGRDRRQSLINTAADLFGTATLEDAAGFIGPRSVAKAADKAVGTVSHHFPGGSGRDLRLQALRCAISRGGHPDANVLAQGLGGAIDGVDFDGDRAREEIADALIHQLSYFSPGEGPRDLMVEAGETAHLVAAAVAPRDSATAEILREVHAPRLKIYAEISEALVAKLRRVWADGLSGPVFAQAATALANGFIWARRFDHSKAPLALYADMMMRLLEASTVPQTAVEPDDYRLSLFGAAYVPPTSGLDHGKRAAIFAAVHHVYDDRNRWEDVTVKAVADRANVSRPTVVANFHDRNGLAAALWTRHLRGLEDELERGRRLSLSQALHAYLDALVAAARYDKYVTGAFLDGVFAYTVQHGAPNPEDPADPRNLVRIPPMLAPLIEENRSKFRDGNAGTPGEALDTAALLVNHSLHLAMTRPHLTPREVVRRISETTLAGMLKQRPRMV